MDLDKNAEKLDHPFNKSFIQHVTGKVDLLNSEGEHETSRVASLESEHRLGSQLIKLSQ